MKIKNQSAIFLRNDVLNTREGGLLAEHHLAVRVRDVALHEALVDEVGDDALHLVDVQLVALAQLPVERVREVLRIDHRLPHQLVHALEQVPVENQLQLLHEKVEPALDPQLRVLLDHVVQQLVVARRNPLRDIHVLE
jgi:hypothetical protein